MKSLYVLLLFIIYTDICLKIYFKNNELIIVDFKILLSGNNVQSYSIYWENIAN